jgi:hypothetical protein
MAEQNGIVVEAPIEETSQTPFAQAIAVRTARRNEAAGISDD